MNDRPAYAQLRKMVRMATADSWTSPTVVDERTQKLYNQLLADAATVRGAARTASGQQPETHSGYDIAGYPEPHAGPREKCPDPACETDQHATCGAECPAVGQPAEAQATDEAETRVRWGVESRYPNGGTFSLPAVDDRTSAEKYLKATRESSPEATHRLVRETTTWTVEDETR
ncbi:hypothetical protein [Streptomyces sp. NPDC058664]|uniref:hypothetical protein n=1 Tax=unclassified Streptomyces TaxID=2593676 RepID=UPI0036605121